MPKPSLNKPSSMILSEGIPFGLRSQTFLEVPKDCLIYIVALSRYFGYIDLSKYGQSHQ